MFAVAMVLTAVFAFNPINAGAVETSGSASVDFMSQYIWRGLQLSDEIVIQPSVGITYGGFGANLWTNYDTDTDEQNETDLTLNYANSIDKFSYDAGYIYYALDGFDDTQEVYLSLAYDVILSPSLTIYYDFDEGEGAFIVAAVGHSFELPKGLTLDLGASASYNADNLVMGTDEDGDEFSDFYNADVSASLTIPVTEAISIAPMVAYSFSLSDDAKDVLEAVAEDVTGDADADVFYGGVNISLSF
jgi:hypothetical protein